MNKILDKKYPYLMNFFASAVKQNRLFHSIILYGSNNYIQYAIALELARLLNCLENGREDCSCRNCRWIRENKHPAVMTISKIDNKPAGDLTKTVISVQQTELVLNSVFSASDYHKVFIFCDADMKTLSVLEQEKCSEFSAAGFSSPQTDEGGKIWMPSSINKNCFQEAAANSMLKSIEEPPGHVTFIFLTNNPNDLISTIVSRSQAFYAPDARRTDYNTDFLKKYYARYPEFDKNSVFEFSEELLNLQNEKGYEPEYILNCFRFYLIELLKQNPDNNMLKQKIFKDLTEIDKAGRMIKSYIKEAYIYEHLGFYAAGMTS